MTAQLTRHDCEGFQKCISNALHETDDMLWNGSDEDGNVKTKTLTGKDRENLTCFVVYYVYEINSKTFSLDQVFQFWGSPSSLGPIS